MDSEGNRHPSFAEALRFWLKLGFISFGGPTGQIAIMHEELVEKKRWVSERRFLHALNYCMLLPGPEATQLAIYIGWLLHKTRGGIVAGVLFVLPAIFVLWALSYVYVVYGGVAWIAAIFYGLKPAVLAIVATAVIRIGKKVLKNEVMWMIACAAFVAIYFFKVPFPLIVLGASLAGLIGGKMSPGKFSILGGEHSGGDAVLGDDTKISDHTRVSWLRSLKVLVVGILVWLAPLLVVGTWLGTKHTLFTEGVFFSKAALVTFGGAYAVLPYVSQQAVEKYEWLNAGQMLDGLGLAETTPGPLIMVLQFVGFLGGWNQPGGLPPLLAASLGAFITTWCTFVPCFLFIFLGAPYIEQSRGNARLNAALSAVTAAVVGVILNLAVWFGQHALFPGGSIDWFVLLVALAAFAGMIRWKWGVVPVVIGGGVLGLLYKLAM